MINFQFLRTRVARRIMLLFCICSLLPMLAVTTFSYIYTKNQLYDQNRMRLRQATKSITTSIYERLNLLQNEMRVWSQIPIGDPRLDKRNDAPLSLSEDILRSFEKIHTNDRLDRFDNTERPHLAAGKPLLRIDNSPNERPHLDLFLLAGSTGNRQVVLRGSVREDTLWHVTDQLATGSMLCVLDAAGNLLYSSEPRLAPDLLNQFKIESRSHAGLFDYAHQDHDYIGSYTHLFLKSNFHYPQLKIIVGANKEIVLAPIGAFKYIFPIIVILTLCLMLLFSVRLIQKNLTPIELLQAASRKISEGDLNSGVHINSRDEFEDLGKAFNQMQENLRKSQALLVRKSKMATMGQMAAGLAHEIKQPLTAIHGHVSLWQMEMPQDDPLQQRIDILLGAINRITSLMNQFGSMAAKPTGQKQSVHLPTLIQKVEDLFKHQIDNNRVAIQAEYQPDLPPIMARPDDIQQVISNLLVNAMHAMESKSPEARKIIIMVYHLESQVIFVFEDSGCGIEPEVQQQMFNPFFSTKPSEKGSGLGMAIVESILHDHQASIQCESKVGVGTRFTIKFPEAGHH